MLERSATVEDVHDQEWPTHQECHEIREVDGGRQTDPIALVGALPASFSLPTGAERSRMALHLAFFHASWGLYRPTSFLLQKEFMVHLPAVSILKSPKFNPLWHMPVDRAHEDAMLKLTLKSGDDIRTVYLPDHASDTLVTKVLLSTICCTPAFDKFARIGLQKVANGAAVLRTGDAQHIFALSLPF
jgi:hypothetical protein